MVPRNHVLLSEDKPLFKLPVSRVSSGIGINLLGIEQLGDVTQRYIRVQSSTAKQMETTSKLATDDISLLTEAFELAKLTESITVQRVNKP